MIGRPLCCLHGQHDPCYNSFYIIAITECKLFQWEVPSITKIKLASCTWAGRQAGKICSTAKKIGLHKGERNKL